MENDIFIELWDEGTPVGIDMMYESSILSEWINFINEDLWQS